ncbi:nucleoside 2-deoxyribosyltransferase domain-containing protein [Streptomyces roseoverticillatus]|uniref:nucleoside 2-deoxyribosyltransferase domain-containing protein n=1 Tax=Streptomyces roseoverticillatus TaxID=66429 RepID=UPI001F456946|nr:nucleoside 2-deoxyribosyltransferase domain-containing protein [Streptomyces roseoverticillatus]MCF3105444.1 nucleoside 2-deoxyribosyltransferase domain-containing protein [Streptomyces roseoverticillatus]
MTELQRLAGALATDYLSGQWTPDPTEEHRARILSLSASADVSLEGLAGGGVITGEAIMQMLRPHPDLASWQLAPVLRAYLTGDDHGQALVRDLLDAVAGMHQPPAGRHVRSPDRYDGSGPAVFLAGGITGCPDWQTRAALRLRAAGVTATILNPRRPDFPEGDPAASRQQIAWEYQHLHRADVVLFWFCAESIQPIALYELGAHAARGTKIAVGTHPDYERRLDITEQLRHARPDVEIHASLADTVRAAAALVAPYGASLPD